MRDNKDTIYMELVGVQDVNSLAQALIALDQEEAEHQGTNHSNLQVKANKSGHILIGYFADKKKEA